VKARTRLKEDLGKRGRPVNVIKVLTARLAGLHFRQAVS